MVSNLSPKRVAVARYGYLAVAEQLKRNPGQWQAYESSGHCVILAGPGSGKTKTLTAKLARMVAEDVRSPREIACITYNNHCVREIKKRMSEMGLGEASRVFIGTLHSFCLRHIVLPFAHLSALPKKYPIKVASTREIEIFQQNAVDEIIGDGKWDSRFDKYRREHLDRQAPSWREDDEISADVIETYETYLDQEGLIDFDGMILIGLHLVENYSWVRKALAARFPILAVDEYQDLGYALDKIVRSLCFEAGIRLLAVGDPDQSIYGFTGAEPSLLKSLGNRQDVETIRLSLNYRCGSVIIQASEIALGESRDFESATPDPGVVYFHEMPDGIESQAGFICEQLIPEAIARRRGRTRGDIAVLYIDRNDGDIIATSVGQQGWPFIRIDGNSPYQPSPVTYWLEDCAAWCAGGWRSAKIRLSDIVRRWVYFNESLRLEKDRRVAQAALVKCLYSNRDGNLLLNEWLLRVLVSGLDACLEREPRLRDDKEKIKRLVQLSASEGPMSKWSVAFFGGQSGSPDHLNLTTLHSAKGLEYDVVIMFGLEEGRIPYFYDNDNAIREKKRLFYVGLTRARHEVHLVYSGWYSNRYGKVFQNGRSRFVNEIENDLIQW
jgi:DNA helicase-2/ATP-dependent DNA helicase PcrA